MIVRSLAWWSMPISWIYLFVPVIVPCKVCPEACRISNWPLVQPLIVSPAIDARPWMIGDLYQSIFCLLQSRSRVSQAKVPVSNSRASREHYDRHLGYICETKLRSKSCRSIEVGTRPSHVKVRFTVCLPERRSKPLSDALRLHSIDLAANLFCAIVLWNRLKSPRKDDPTGAFFYRMTCLTQSCKNDRYGDDYAKWKRFLMSHRGRCRLWKHTFTTCRQVVVEYAYPVHDGANRNEMLSSNNFGAWTALSGANQFPNCWLVVITQVHRFCHWSRIFRDSFKRKINFGMLTDKQ